MMVRKSVLFTTAALAAAIGLAATAAPAEAQWRHYGGGGYRYGGYYPHYYRGVGPGAVVGGALLGLGVGALLAAPYVAPPPVVYAPRPYYPAPAYYPQPYYPSPYYYPPY